MAEQSQQGGLAYLVSAANLTRAEGLEWLRTTIGTFAGMTDLDAEWRFRQIQGALAEFKACFPDKRG